MSVLNEAGVAPGSEMFPLEFSLLENLKVLFGGILGAVGPGRSSQEIMLALADMVLQIFALESALLRAEKMVAAASDRKQEMLRALVKLVAFAGSEQFHHAASRCCGYADLKQYRSILRKNIQRLSYYPVDGLLGAKQGLAAACLDARRYML